MTPSPPALATATRNGLLSFIAQTIAGIKTFTSVIVAAVGIQVASLFNTNGTGSTDVGVSLGVSTADGSVHASAKLLSVRTGIGGTEVEKVSVNKAGDMTLAGGLVVSGVANSRITSDGSRVDIGNGGTIPARALYMVGSSSTTAFYASANGAFSAPGTVRLWSETLGGSASDVLSKVGSYISDGSVNASAKLFSVRTGLGGTEVEKFFVTKAGNAALLQGSALYFNGAVASGCYVWASDTTTLKFGVGNADVAQLSSGGRFDQSGTDDSANAGNRTVNKPTGTNKLANGATTCVITNSLCSATSRVMVTFHDDPGARYWVTRAAGSFTVNLSAAAGADKVFSWEVSNII